MMEPPKKNQMANSIEETVDKDGIEDETDADMFINSTCRDKESGCSIESEPSEGEQETSSMDVDTSTSPSHSDKQSDCGEEGNGDGRSSTETDCSDRESNCDDKSSENFASEQGIEEEGSGDNVTDEEEE